MINGATPSYRVNNTFSLIPILMKGFSGNYFNPHTRAIMGSK